MKMYKGKINYQRAQGRSFLNVLGPVCN